MRDSSYELFEEGMRDGSMSYLVDLDSSQCGGEHIGIVTGGE